MLLEELPGFMEDVRIVREAYEKRKAAALKESVTRAKLSFLNKVKRPVELEALSSLWTEKFAPIRILDKPFGCGKKSAFEKRLFFTKDRSAAWLCIAATNFFTRK